MKKIVAIITLASAVVFGLGVTLSAEDKPVDYKKLPAPAKEFIKKYFPGDKVVNASKDDDLVRPEYEVYLSSGAKIDFEHSGALEKVKTVGAPVPEALIPVKIKSYVDSHYAGVTVQEYEVGKADYEVKLSNGLELKFNTAFKLIDIDD